MIDSATRKKLIRELEKDGNVYVTCAKIGISPATFYRWREGDKKFKQLADRAVRFGRLNNCDIGEHSLMKNVRGGDMGAIKYLLSHNSARYKTQDKREKEKVLEEQARARTYYAGYSDALREFGEKQIRVEKTDEEKKSTALDENGSKLLDRSDCVCGDGPCKCDHPTNECPA